MIFRGPIAGRNNIACGILGSLLLLLGSAAALPADQFPFDQELLLDVARMGHLRRVPVLTIESNGNATIDLWCKTVAGRVELSDSAIHIEAGPLPDALPAMMSDGQCTPERMRADEDTLAALTQVNAWRRQGSSVLLEGPKALKFRPSDH